MRATSSPQVNFGELRKAEVRRIILPRTPVNRVGSKGDKNSRPSLGMHAFADQFVGILQAHPTTDLRLLVALQPLVCLKELLDLAQVLIGQVLQGAYLCEARIVVGDGQHI